MPLQPTACARPMRSFLPDTVTLQANLAHIYSTVSFLCWKRTSPALAWSFTIPSRCSRIYGGKHSGDFTGVWDRRTPRTARTRLTPPRARRTRRGHTKYCSGADGLRRRRPQQSSLTAASARAPSRSTPTPSSGQGDSRRMVPVRRFGGTGESVAGIVSPAGTGLSKPRARQCERSEQCRSPGSRDSGIV